MDNKSLTIKCSEYETATVLSECNSTGAIAVENTIDKELHALYIKLYYVAFACFIILGPTLLLVSLFSNTVAAIALWSRVKKVSTFNYLLAISFLDMIYVMVHNILYVPYFAFSVNIFKYLSCGFISFLIYVPSQMSSWCLAACCVERAFIVRYPTKAKLWFTPKRARIVLILISIMIFATNWHVFGGMKVTTDGKDGWIGKSCKGQNAEVDLYLRVVYPWVDMSMYSLVPAAILIMTSLVTIYSFIKARNTIGPVNPANITMNKVSLRTTYVSIALAVVFFVNTFPLSVSIIYSLLGPSLGVSKKSILESSIIIAVLNNISLLNHCVNLYIYMVFSKDFRRDVRKILTCRCREVVGSNTAVYPIVQANQQHNEHVIG